MARKLNKLGLNARQEEIMKLVYEFGYISIDLLADRFGLSQQKVRSDIIFLSEQSLVQRHHGGTALLN